MTKRTVEVFECDLCGEPGERYAITYPDGTLALDRCPRDAIPILAFKEEAGGQWTPTGVSGKSSFKVSSLDDIIKQRGVPS
jgi:hypothetical protein